MSLTSAHGSQILIGVVLALIGKNKERLLRTDGLPEFCDIFREAQRACFDSDELIAAARDQLKQASSHSAISSVKMLQTNMQETVADSLERRRYEVIMQVFVL